MCADVQSEVGTMSFCASCGVKEGDDIKLRDCSACHLVKYCGVACQKEHRKKHKRACKRRAAELHDEILFRQPESSCFGDCPICFLPLSLDPVKSTMMTCCSKLICDGCDYANQKREIQERRHPKCPFCRRPVPKSEAEIDKRLIDRAEMNDPVAMREIGLMRHHDNGDYQSAFEYLSKAAELGDASAHGQLGTMYRNGQGVEKNESKEVYHYEKAAIGGHPMARYKLGVNEFGNGRYERAINHFTIAAKLGNDNSLESLKKAYTHGFVGNDDLAAALRGHQAAVDATKSPHREAAEAAK